MRLVEGKTVPPEISSLDCGLTRSFQPGNAGRTRVRRTLRNGTPNQSSPGWIDMKTMAIRLDDEQHAQLSVIAQLEELTVTDAIRGAIDQWIEQRRKNPELQARAEAVLADIDREAQTRRGAISALLKGEKAPGSGQGDSAPAQRSSRSRSKGSP